MEGLVNEIRTSDLCALSRHRFQAGSRRHCRRRDQLKREAQNRPTSLRTHILTCVAAAMIAVLGIEITQFEVFEDKSIKMDPIRLIEAVTAGVALLAAGTILMARGEVHGLTTGAGMWLAAGLGLACGRRACGS